MPKKVKEFLIFDKCIFSLVYLFLFWMYLKLHIIRTEYQIYLFLINFNFKQSMTFWSLRTIIFCSFMMVMVIFTKSYNLFYVIYLSIHSDLNFLKFNHFWFLTLVSSIFDSIIFWFFRLIFSMCSWLNIFIFFLNKFYDVFVSLFSL